MALYPHAEHKLLPENSTQPKIKPRAAILHSAGGGSELYGWWMNPGSRGLESHFWIDWDGRVVQYMDTEVRADANGDANSFAVSFETASSVHATEGWTVAQMESIVRLLDWLVQVHPAIERRQMRHARDSGIGWHVMFGAPGPWTGVRGKVCPGGARIEQIKQHIIPAVQDAAHSFPHQEYVDVAGNAVTKEEVQAIITDAVSVAVKIELESIVKEVRRDNVILRDLGANTGWSKAAALKLGVTQPEAAALDPRNNPKAGEFKP